MRVGWVYLLLWSIVSYKPPTVAFVSVGSYVATSYLQKSGSVVEAWSVLPDNSNSSLPWFFCFAISILVWLQVCPEPEHIVLWIFYSTKG